MKYLVVFILLQFLIFYNGVLQAQWVPTGPAGDYVFSLAVSGTNTFAGTSVGFYLSTNNGTGWGAKNDSLTNTYVRSLAVIGTNIFAGTNGGEFLSTDNGTNWKLANNGMTGGAVYALAVSGTNLDRKSTRLNFSHANISYAV